MAYIHILLPSTVTATIVSVFILSRIENLHSLLFYSTHDITSNLQPIQDYADCAFRNHAT